MAKLSCPTCEPIDCCVPSGLDDYLLVGPTFLNNQVSVLFDCPTGYLCTPGVYPLLITIKKGEIPWNPPVIPPVTPLILNCCDGRIVRDVPAGISAAAYTALLQSMVDEAARRLAGCKEKGFRSQAKKATSAAQTVLCPGGDDIFNISGLPLSAFLPSAIKISADGKGLTISAGVFSGATKAEADAKAIAFLTSQFNAAIAANKLHCGLIAAPCSLFEDDNTVVGQVSGNLTPPHTSILAGLDPGYYELQLAAHAYELIVGQWSVNPTIGNPVMQYDFTGIPGGIQFMHGDNGDPGFPFPNEAAAVANYQAQLAGTVTPVLPVLWQYGSAITITTVGFFTPTGPTIPVFNVVRKRKLTLAQPTNPTLTLEPVATARFSLTYTQTTPGILVSAASAAVETALNALPAIVADGGVTVAGNAVAGFVVTWNLNGARTPLNSRVTTASPGIVGNTQITQPGNAGQVEIQTVTVTFCTNLVAGTVEPVWPGTFPVHYLADAPPNVCQSWVNESVANNGPCAVPPTTLGSFQINGWRLRFAEIRLVPAGLPTPSGCGWTLGLIGESSLLPGVSEDVWLGIKADGLTPAGVYTWTAALPWPPGSIGCSVDQTHGVQQLTIV